MKRLKVILAERRTPREKSLIHELESLAETVGYNVEGCIVQIREPSSTYQIGSGKADELAKLVEETAAEKIIFENELKPVQAYNLAKKTKVEVISKFQLILEVFSEHAFTREAKLQIELARLRYELTRAKEKVRLAKLGEQPGFHGLGKYEVDVYYRELKNRINHIEKRLRKIRNEKKSKRLARALLGYPVISLSGYTAAGKTTLFNQLTSGEAKVEGKLFTTLSTKISAAEFNGKKTLLVDTVGFIDGLPITLIEAFRSTLEETIFADIIILVVDCSEELDEIKRKLKCCLNTLHDIGIFKTPIVTALNKIDLLSPSKIRETVEQLKDYAPNPTPISALKGINIGELTQCVSANLKNYILATFKLPLSSDSFSLVSKARKLSTVFEENIQGNSLMVKIVSLDYVMDKIKSQVEILGGKITEVRRA